MPTLNRLRALVQLVETFGEDSSTLNEICAIFKATGIEIDAIPSIPTDMFMNRLLFSPEQASRLCDALPEADRVARRIDSPWLSVILRGDALWPEIVDIEPRAMMPWLTVLGDASVLSAPAVGVVGSRQATGRRVEITADMVRGLVSRGMVIVSGGARGIDTAAHRAALDHGGRTIVVLAQGLGTFPVPSHWWPLIERGQLIVVSEFSPADGWDSHRALQRNSTIVRLSVALLVIQAGEMSGTLNAGRSALRLKRPLFVVTHPNSNFERFAGNDRLIAAGGVPLNVPSVGVLPPSVLDMVAGADVEPAQEHGHSVGQMRLL